MIPAMKNFMSEFKDYLIVTLGTVIYVLAWTSFMIPNGIASGGGTGLCTIIYFATDGAIPVATSFFVLNAILLMIGFLVLGKAFGIKTIYVIILSTVLFDVFPRFDWTVSFDEKFLEAVVGGILEAVGIGLVLLKGGSTGGTDIAAMIVNKYWPVSPGKVYLYSDLFIIASILFIPGKTIEDMIYGFTLTDNPGYTGASLKINSLTSYPLRLLDGTTAAEIKAEEGEIYYCVQFKGTYWLWLGHLQSYAKVEDNDPDSPFYVEGKVGRIHTVFTGGEYENIYSDELARERAELELYLHSFMNDSLTLTCSPVYFLDVNILTSYTSKRTGETKQYLIKNINMGLAPSDSMTVQLTRFTPEIFNSDY